MMETLTTLFVAYVWLLAQPRGLVVLAILFLASAAVLAVSLHYAEEEPL